MNYKSTLLLFLLSTYFYSSASKCPPKCSCYLDSKGRKTVECKEGGMIGPLTLVDVELNTRVLRITAPEDNMNSLQMSPDIQSFKKLEEIHITRSNVPILGKYFFYGLNKLEILNFAQNNITQILDHNFYGIVNLKELYLDDNTIFSLPSGTFTFIADLKVLSIQRNRIKELMPRMFLGLKKLKVLKLSGNYLRELKPEVFEDVPVSIFFYYIFTCKFLH